jgi:general secretion pathway protein G
VLKQKRSDQDHKNVIEQGFTLVELLIVIVILGILAGIVVFAVGNLTSNAKTSACGTDKAAMQTAVESFKAYTGGYPQGATPAARLTALNGGSAGVLLKSTSPNYEISDNSGSVTAISGNANGCT